MLIYVHTKPIHVWQATNMTVRVDDCEQQCVYIYIYTCYILKYFTYLLILARCPTWPSQAMHFICKALYDIVFISLIINSQTSDSMERWKSRGGKSQGGEEKK